MQKFAVLSPMTGDYTQFDTLELAVSQASQLAVEMFMQHVHNAPISVVNVAEDGSETWSSSYGMEGLSPEQVRAALDTRVKQMEAIINAGVIPTTAL